MLDAYTVKKAIPRVVIAVIAINLSIYLCITAIDVTTILGRGLHGLLVAPFIEPDSFSKIEINDNVENVGIAGVLGLGALTGLMTVIFSGGATFVWLLGLFGPMILTVVLIALAVLFTLIVRQGLLVFLTVISPVAIACYILPGTEKYFKQWWDLFIKTLMVYPIIAAIFAMCNVLAAILLNTATAGGGSSMFPGNYFAQQSDAMGTLQIVTAIIVLYLPLVLIPFAFKLAGGAIAAVMNVASSRANSLAGKGGQAIQKSRQDPNTWLGSRANKARQNRMERGWSGGQVMSGLGGGAGALVRGRSFRSGYSAASGSLGRNTAFDKSTEAMESAAFKAFGGNDDSLWALRNGRNASEVRNILASRGYGGADLDQATSQIMRFKKQYGNTVANIAGSRAQAKTGTGYEDNAHMLQDIITSSEGDMGVGARMLAEMRGSAQQSGRMDLASSGFATQMVAMDGIRQSMSGGGQAAQAYAMEQANNDVMRSAIDSNSGAAAVYGKPSSAAAFARAHRGKITEYMDSLSSGRRININGEQRVATARDVKQAMASAHGVHDAMQGASPQNARAFADELMGAGINVGNLSAEARAALGPAWAQQNMGESSLGPDGNLTVRQVMDGLMGQDQEYMEMRRDFANQTQAEASRARQGAQTAAAAGPPPTPNNGPPPPP